MTYVVFTASESSRYDDDITRHYHFPKTYLAQASAAVGGWVVFYEPRRDAGLSSSGGRQAYFAMAQLDRIDPDPDSTGHYYARLSGYVEFDRAVPFSEGQHYYESALRKADGSTNKGAFGRSVRVLPQEEFWSIARVGFAHEIEPWESPTLRVAEEVPAYVERPVIEQVVSRKFRDEAFRRHVRFAYDKRCAMSGLRLINGGGRPEVQAAHIRPVEANGPDTVRNGMALTGTFHWLFDRGLVTVSDDYRILLSPQGVPDDLDRLIVPDRRLMLPQDESQRPHPTYLSWHREHRFKR